MVHLSAVSKEIWQEVGGMIPRRLSRLELSYGHLTRLARELESLITRLIQTWTLITCTYSLIQLQ